MSMLELRRRPWSWETEPLDLALERASMFAAAQKAAMLVPTIHPDPVMLPRSSCPLCKLIVVEPSETQSVFPVIAMMQPEGTEKARV